MINPVSQEHDRVFLGVKKQETGFLGEANQSVEVFDDKPGFWGSPIACSPPGRVIPDPQLPSQTLINPPQFDDKVSKERDRVLSASRNRV
jgi:hypothetical protein